MRTRPVPSRRSLAALIARVVLVTLIALVAAPAVVDAEPEVPPERQALIFAKVLTYDQNLTTRAGSSVDIAILYVADDAASEQGMATMKGALAALTSMSMQGLAIHISTLPYTTPEALAQAIEVHGLDTLYLAPGLDASLDAILAVSRERDAATLTASRALVQRGVALGVVVKDNKPSIMVNLPASRAEGMSLSSDLLGLAEVVR